MQHRSLGLLLIGSTVLPGLNANSDRTHEGRRVYRGDFAATLRNACHVAVGAPKGQRIRVVGMENLKRKA
jgi:hypothetical protein